MELTYKITKEDYLDYSMYASSRSKVQRHIRRRHYWSVLILYSTLGVIALVFKIPIVAASLFAAAFIWLLVYPRYSKYRYRNHFRKSVNEQLKTQLYSDVTIRIEEDGLYSKDVISEGKIYYSSILKIVEIQQQYLLLLPQNMGLVLPKDQIPHDELMNFLRIVAEKTSLSIKPDLERKWL